MTATLANRKTWLEEDEATYLKEGDVVYLKKTRASLARIDAAIEEHGPEAPASLANDPTKPNTPPPVQEAPTYHEDDGPVVEKRRRPSRPAPRREPSIDYVQAWQTGGDVSRVARKAQEMLTTAELPDRQRAVATYLLHQMETLGYDKVVAPARVIARAISTDADPVVHSTVEKALQALDTDGTWVVKVDKYDDRTAAKVRRGTKFGNEPAVYTMAHPVQRLVALGEAS